MKPYILLSLNSFLSDDTSSMCISQIFISQLLTVYFSVKINEKQRCGWIFTSHPQQSFQHVFIMFTWKGKLSAVVIFRSLLVSLLSRPLLSRIGNSKRTFTLLWKRFLFKTMMHCICELFDRRKCHGFYLQLRVLLETPKIAKLWYAASRNGNCAKTNFYVLEKVNSVGRNCAVEIKTTSRHQKLIMTTFPKKLKKVEGTLPRFRFLYQNIDLKNRNIWEKR